MVKPNKNKNRVFKRQNKSRCSLQERKDDVIKLKQTEMNLITKKAKRLQKKSSFISKLCASKEAKEQLNKAKQRARTVIVGDMNPLLDALTDIATDTANNAKQKEKQVVEVTRKKNMPSEKRRQKSDLKDIELFKRVSAHPKYVTNPINAISDHVKYLIQLQEADQI